MEKQVWTKVGKVAVDSGTVMVLDPCVIGLLIPKAKEAIDVWYEESVCANWDTDNPIRLSAGSQSAAVGHLVSTGNGDGIYDVEVRMTSEGRVAELRIKFIDDEE